MSSALSPKMNAFEGSASLAISEQVARLRAEGRQIIPLNVGEPDFPTPENIKQAGIRAIQENFTRYTVGSGLPELRKAISEKLKRENNILCPPEEIAVSVGAKQALMSALTAIAGEGDEVMIPTPCYVSYPDMVKLAGAVPVFPSLHPDTYELDPEAIRRCITPRTKALILCSPNNPTGAVFSEESLRAAAALAVEHDFLIIADEVYEKLVFGRKHFSIASISEEVRRHTITVNGFSKTYAMTGWRIGYAAARPDIIAAINKIQSQQTTCVSGFVQKAAIEALKGPQEVIEDMRRSYEERMQYVYERLNAMPGVSCPKAYGAFYLFPDVSACLQEGSPVSTDTELCSYLLEEAGIALVPGTAYYRPGAVRISYAISMEELRAAMDQMEAALLRLCAKSALPLRPHHGMCFRFYEGKGYSEFFTDHMGRIVRLLTEDPSRQIRLTLQTDCVCEHCPNNVQGVCSSAEKVAAYDRSVLQLCGLKEGDTLSYQEFSERVTERILASGHRKEICSDCQWNTICEAKEISS